jgi:hypothetical protein
LQIQAYPTLKTWNKLQRMPLTQGATEIWWLETMAAEKKRYLVVTTAGNIMAEGFDILDATLIINHQMGSKGILAVVEQNSDGEKHLKHGLRSPSED